MAQTHYPTLVGNCRDCQKAPVYRTRQRAFMARPTLEWHQCCEAHRPGAKVGAPMVTRFHETQRLIPTLIAPEGIKFPSFETRERLRALTARAAGRKGA
jgi:hypothetical protein